MSEIKTEIKENGDCSYTITDAHTTADILRWLLTQDTKETILFILNEEALAEQPAQQEPVAYGMWDTMLGKGNRMMMVRLDRGQDGCTVPLYTTPQPPAQPLTDEQIAKCYERTGHYQALRPQDRFAVFALARAIEAAHGITKGNT